MTVLAPNPDPNATPPTPHLNTPNPTHLPPGPQPNQQRNEFRTALNPNSPLQILHINPIHPQIPPPGLPLVHLHPVARRAAEAHGAADDVGPPERREGGERRVDALVQETGGLCEILEGVGEAWGSVGVLARVLCLCGGGVLRMSLGRGKGGNVPVEETAGDVGGLGEVDGGDFGVFWDVDWRRSLEWLVGVVTKGAYRMLEALDLWRRCCGWCP